VHRPTIAIYEADAADYTRRRGVQRPERAGAFAAAVGGGLRLDLGCGPGHYLPLLGRPAVALDAAEAMTRLAAGAAPEVPAVQGDLASLPFGRRSLAGVWASKAHQHVAAADLAEALAEVHRVLAVGARFDLTVFAGAPDTPTTEELTDAASDDLPGRWFTWWEPEHLRDVIEAAGFRVDALDLVPARHPARHARIEVTATAVLALPDHVGPDMALLCCGLNPSRHSAEAGVPYVTGSNRFWRALAAAGLSDDRSTRNPRRLLAVHRVGMTDLVKRPTTRADEVTTAEYQDGVERLRRLCEWLRPKAVAMVGLHGWRLAVDRKTLVGWQAEPVGPTPVYVLPSTSGLNARVPLAELADHLRSAARGPQ
jgi:TDG/mug DNA glycosylase family protein